MNIVICGAGEVGSHAAEVLASVGKNVTVIDSHGDRLGMIGDSLDVATLKGNCAEAAVLREAGTVEADLLLATTDRDEINLLTACVAKALGVPKVIARVHHRAFFEQIGLDYKSHLSIDKLICPEYSTALAIAGTLRNPGVLAIHSFGGGAIQLQEFEVGPKAPALRRTLQGLDMPTGSRVAAVLRNSYAFLPDASTQIEPKDLIVLVANSPVFEQARRLFREDDSARKSMVIMGGPAMSVWLCRALRDMNLSIRLFEPNRQRAEELAHKLEWVTVLAADPTDPSVFEEEHIARADVFVALTNDDEYNILGCAWAKSMGVQRTIAVTQQPKYLHLLSHVGIDHAFSPRMVAVREIEEMIEEAPIRRVATLVDGIIDVYRIRVGEHSAVAGKSLREVGLTPDSLIVAIANEAGARLPGPEDVLQPKEVVLVVGRHGLDATLERTFAAR